MNTGVIEKVIENLYLQIQELSAQINGVSNKTILPLAQAFTNMNDDQQAQFFVEVAKIMKTWTSSGGMSQQAYYIGRHLATCKCSTEDSRELIRMIYAYEALEKKIEALRVDSANLTEARDLYKSKLDDARVRETQMTQHMIHLNDVHRVQLKSATEGLIERNKVLADALIDLYVATCALADTDGVQASYTTWELMRSAMLRVRDIPGLTLPEAKPAWLEN